MTAGARRAPPSTVSGVHDPHALDTPGLSGNGLHPLLVATRAILDGLPESSLRPAHEALSARYRAERGPDRLLSPNEVLAYAATRLPATLGATVRVLEELARRDPEFSPTSMLDLGAGLGGASWAAAGLFASISRFALVERDREMTALGRRLQLATASPALREAAWSSDDAAAPSARADLLVASYLLGEINPSRRSDAVTSWWAATGGALVVVEPGTPDGAARIITARRELLGVGAMVLAPCPHERPCPLATDDWCHFSVRVGRSALHRSLKDGTRSFEDEKFSYLVVSRAGRRATGRVLRRATRRSGYLRLVVCGDNGIAVDEITRRDPKRYRAARNLDWGDATPER